MFERLTFRDSLGVACYRWELPSRTEVIANEAISRLAAYEDSGLSPEEVQELKVSVKICEDCWNHAQAKAEGRLVELPVKVGDTVYEANKNRNIVSTYRVTHITIMTDSINYGWELLEGIYSNLNGFNEHALGKTVFLSRETAEKALEVRE